MGAVASDQEAEVVAGFGCDVEHGDGVVEAVHGCLRVAGFDGGVEAHEVDDVGEQFGGEDAWVFGGLEVGVGEQFEGGDGGAGLVLWAVPFAVPFAVASAVASAGGGGAVEHFASAASAVVGLGGGLFVDLLVGGAVEHAALWFASAAALAGFEFLWVGVVVDARERLPLAGRGGGLRTAARGDAHGGVGVADAEDAAAALGEHFDIDFGAGESEAPQRALHGVVDGAPGGFDWFCCHQSHLSVGPGGARGVVHRAVRPALRRLRRRRAALVAPRERGAGAAAAFWSASVSVV